MGWNDSLEKGKSRISICFEYNSSIQIDITGAEYAEIFDINGRVIGEFEIADDGFSWHPEETIESGVYLVRAFNSHSSSIERIVYIK